MTILNSVFGTIIRFFCEICGNNYAVGIFVFTLIVNVALLPLNIKQQKGTAKQARMKNKLAKLQVKYKDDKQKYQEEMGKLYSQAGSSPFSGCLLMFVRFPIFICIYTAVREALTYIFQANAELITNATEVIKSGVLGDAVTLNERAPQLSVLQHLDALVNHDSSFADLTNGLNIDFSLFGIKLLDVPSSTVSLIWIVPILSFLTAMGSSIFSLITSKKTNPGANNQSMGCMLLLMPLFSLWIAFTVPGAVGWYWVCSNFVSTIIMIFLQKLYFPGKVIAKIEAKEARKRREYEQSIIHPVALVDGKQVKTKTRK